MFLNNPQFSYVFSYFDHNTDGVSEQSEFDENEDVSILKKVQKRAQKREKRRLKLKKTSAEEEVLKTKKLVNTKNKSGEALEMARLQNKLGVNGCLACRR